MGSVLEMPALRDGARTLMKLMPADSTTVEQLRTLCMERAKLGETSLSPALEALFFGPSASRVLYLMEVVYSLLMPANVPLGDEATDFQFSFARSGGTQLVLCMLGRNNFLPNADSETRRAAYHTALKIAKLLLTAVAYGHLRAIAEACQGSDRTGSLSQVSAATHNQAVVLQDALHLVPSLTAECTLRNIAMRLGQQITNEASKNIPDISVIRAIQKIAWASGCGSITLVFAANEEICKVYQKNGGGKDPDTEDEQVCCEALEVLTLCLALAPSGSDMLSKDRAWQLFIVDLLLHCQSRYAHLSPFCL
uniref:ubiquitin carboxyl-terminal hydrolase 9X-like n=1 Tax=Myxine glutinosa TaxID=7769 RepID=UPI00358FFCD7